MEEATVLNKKKVKLVPKLRFKGFEEEWEKKEYGDIYSFYFTNSFSRDNLNYESGVVKNIHYGDIHTKFATLFDITKESVPYVNLDRDIKKIKEECYCQEKDLVIADASEDYADIGKTIELVNLNNEKVIAGLHTFLARPDKFEMAKGFAGYLVKSWKFRKQIMTIAQGTKVLSLSTGRLAKIKISIPTLPEQQIIATFLSSVDEKLQQLTRKKELLEHYKKGVMQQLFSGKLRFKDENGKSYKEWEEKRLGLFVQIKSGYSPSSYNFDENGKFPFLKVEELNNSEKYQSASRYYTNDNKDLIRKNSIIFPKRGAAILNNKVRINIIDVLIDTNLMALIPKEGLNFEFLYYKLFFEKLYKIADCSTIPQINNKHIEPYKILMPCIKEQEKIANYLTSIDKKIETIKKEITETQGFKKGLLQQMFV